MSADQNPKGIETRGIARLAADLDCIPADAEQVLREVAECERVIESTEPFDEFTGPMPAEYVPESRYADLSDDERAANVLKAFEPLAKLGKPIPLADMTDCERVRDRVYAHDVADVALACELGTTRHTCAIQAHGRKFFGTGSTYGLAASDALFRLRAWRDHCDERNDEAEQDDEGGAE